MGMIEGLVSIIIPIYNVEKYLHQCVNSALAQTYKNLEIILVDDGSPDNCPQICNEYAMLDSRIIVLHQQNGGLSVARNRGLEIAKGEYIYFLDSDDYINEHAIENLYAEAKRENLDVVLFDSYLINEMESITYSNDYYLRKNTYNEICCGKNMFGKMVNNLDYRSAVPLLFIKQEVLTRCGISFYSGILHEDELFTFLLLLQCAKVKHLSEAFYYRRIRDNSIMTVQKSEKDFIGCNYVFEEMVKFYKINLFDDLVNAAVIKYIIAFFQTSLSIYYVLDDKTQKKLKLEKKNMFKQIKSVKCCGNRKIFIICHFEQIYNLYRRLRNI